MTQTLDETFAEMNGDSKIPVAIFDEAQHLDNHCLDHVKFLTNLERDGGKLLQIVLVGQPELAEKLGQKRFTQLEQRIGAKLRLGTLQQTEILPYLNHRLSVGGPSDDLRFTKRAARYFFKKTLGVPRLINRVANIAVEEALRGKKKKIGVGIVKKAELKVDAARGDWREEKKQLVFSPRLAVLLVLLLVSAGFYLRQHPEWQDFVMGVRRAETQSVPSPSQFTLKVGTFLKRAEADELRERLAKAGFSSAVLMKDLGDGWDLFQVRLTGTYSSAEADSQIDKLRHAGIETVDKIQVSAANAK